VDNNKQMLNDLLSNTLQGKPAPWLDNSVEFEDLFLETSFNHDVQPLLYHFLNKTPEWLTWPERVREAIIQETQFQSVQTLLKKAELERLLEALDQKNIPAILMKGMPLSYQIYPRPHLRPSLDIDLFIQKKDLGAVKEIMTKFDYTPVNSVEGDFVSHQHTFVKEDGHGIKHAYDFHWRISNPAVFSDSLTFAEADQNASGVPGLGKHARSLCLEHALLLACIHRVAHHRHNERLIWLYDIRLLVKKMSAEQIRSFLRFANAKRVRSVCYQGLSLSRQWFGTSLPEAELHAFENQNGEAEPSAVYLRSEKGGIRRNFMLNWKTLPSLKDKTRFLLETVFPSPDYMLKKYSTRSRVLLPILYARRGCAGLLKFLRCTSFRTQ